MIVPNVTLKEKIGPDWHDVETKEYFQKSRVVVFSLPGAFTPVCSNEKLPDYEKLMKVSPVQGLINFICVL